LFKGDLGGWLEGIAEYPLALGSTWDLVLGGGLAAYAFWEDRDQNFYGTYREAERTHFTDRNVGLGPLLRVSAEHRFSEVFAWRLGISGGAAYVAFGSTICPSDSGIGPMYGVWTGPMFTIGQDMQVGISADLFVNVPNMACFNEDPLGDGLPKVNPIDPGDDDGTVTLLGRFRHAL
jgi:hypothetical protein